MAAFAFDLDDDALDRLADVLADRVRARLQEQAPAPGGYLAPQAAADYLGLPRRRVYDLTSSRQLVPDGRDGRTPLFTRDTLDAFVRSQAG